MGEINHEKRIVQERGIDIKKGECSERLKREKLNLEVRNAHAEQAKKVKSCKKEEARTMEKKNCGLLIAKQYLFVYRGEPLLSLLITLDYVRNAIL